MAITISSPVTGAAVSGFTSPSYTFTEDVAPYQHSKQFACTAYGGTQTGVSVHSMSRPFTCTWVRPKSYRLLGLPDLNGIVKNVPRNNWKLITRKGGSITSLSGQPSQVAILTTDFSIPAGMENVALHELKAALSAHIGVLQQQLDNFSSALASGLL